ncbi:MAG TPA: SRPBCC family protein [Candidatus Limnocylindrales bacterium]|nr:SRPBCC family protein [Candidatus Limnocylindrales bacterium]
MAHGTMRDHFEVPIERVFDLYIDVKRWPEWMPGLVEIKEVTGPLDTAGTRMREVSRFLGRTMESWDEIAEVERPRLVKMTGLTEGAKSSMTLRLTPAGQGTDVVIDFDMETPAGFFGHIADRLFIDRAMDRQGRHALENFKALVEAEALVPA